MEGQSQVQAVAAGSLQADAQGAAPTLQVSEQRLMAAGRVVEGAPRLALPPATAAYHQGAGTDFNPTRIKRLFVLIAISMTGTVSALRGKPGLDRTTLARRSIERYPHPE